MLDFDSLLFNIDIPTQTPDCGKLLVAEPFLREAHFCHSVILLVDYAPASSAMGIVLNQPTSYTLQQLVPDIAAAEPIRVYSGGPMSTDRLYFLHTLGDLIPGSRQIADGIWIGGDFDAMLRYLSDGYPTDGIMRFFLGYSGWDAGQLEQEMQSHVWATAAPAHADVLLGTEGDAMWHTIVRSLGDSFRGWQYYPRNIQNN